LFGQPISPDPKLVCALFDEPTLLKQIAEGDRKAFSTLYEQYLGELYRYVYLFTKSKEQSEEIVQDVFLKIWEKRESLAHINSFKAYLYRSAKNLVLDGVRKDTVKLKAHQYLKPRSEQDEAMADERIINRQYEEIAERAIALLPEKRRAIFLMRTRDELSLDEIAAKLSISKSVVKKQLYAAISFVRSYVYKNDIIVVTFISLFFNLF
jgi:RNA polymerase sigma-70 factor (family 1)